MRAFEAKPIQPSVDTQQQVMMFSCWPVWFCQHAHAQYRNPFCYRVILRSRSTSVVTQSDPVKHYTSLSEGENDTTYDGDLESSEKNTDSDADSYAVPVAGIL